MSPTAHCAGGRSCRDGSASVFVEMTTDPDQIRAQVDQLLADVPAASLDNAADVDVDDVARRLEEAHDVLVRALESVEKG